MSTYGFSNAEFGLILHPREKSVKSSFVPEMLYSAPLGESELEKKYGVNLESLKQYVSEHLLSDVEMAIDKANFTEGQIERMYQHCQEETEGIEILTAETIDEDTLIWLIQKANSYSGELRDMEHGNAYNPPQPDDLAVVERIRQYTDPQDI